MEQIFEAIEISYKRWEEFKEHIRVLKVFEVNREILDALDEILERIENEEKKHI